MIVKMNMPMNAFINSNFLLYNTTNGIILLRKENKCISIIFDNGKILVDTLVLDNNDNIIESHGGASILKLVRNGNIMDYAVSLAKKEGYTMSFIAKGNEKEKNNFLQMLANHFPLSFREILKMGQME
jgi:hypothetical protein